MRLHAILDNLVVVEIKNMDESDVISESSHKMVIDIQDMLPQPEVGWVLSGNKLQAPVMSPSDKMTLIMDMRFKFGNDLADTMVKKMSIRNLALIVAGQTLNINTVISTFAGIESAMRKCAIPTAKNGINAMINAYPEYSEEFDYAINEINNYLAKEAAL